MLDTYRQLVSHQYDAALCMLVECVTRCPDSCWHESVANLKFCQVAFHVVFFTDVYLGENLRSLRTQPFHQEHADIFGDYEELEDRLQTALYDKSFLQAYLQHVRDKAHQVMAAETESSLQRISGFDWLKFSRAEVHVYNIRHIHHHAAQLSLYLRMKTGEGIPWVSSGWRANSRES